MSGDLQNSYAGPSMQNDNNASGTQNNNNASGTQNIAGYIWNVSGGHVHVGHPAAANGESLILLLQTTMS